MLTRDKNYTVGLGQKKLHRLIFAVTLLNHLIYFHNFWRTDTEVNLQQSCNKIAHLSWRLFSPYLVKRNISKLFVSAVTYALKVMRVTEKHHSKCSVFAFGFETRIKTILPLINRLINEALLVADHVSIRCCFSSLTSLTGLWSTLIQKTCCTSTCTGWTFQNVYSTSSA